MGNRFESTRRKFTPDARALLASAGNYREFLKIYFRETGISYAEAARRGGFSSRSYPRDVTEGRRRLTAKSLPSLLRGLRLESNLSRVFQLLYFAEHPEEHPEALSSSTIDARLKKDRLRAMRSSRGPIRIKAALPDLKHARNADLLGTSAGLTDVIAALGAMEEGATLEEIQQRTGLSKTTLTCALDTLVREGVANYRGESRRYFPAPGISTGRARAGADWHSSYFNLLSNDWPASPKGTLIGMTPCF